MTSDQTKSPAPTPQAASADTSPKAPADTAASAAPTKKPTPSPLRQRLYQILEAGHSDDALSMWFDAFIVSLILLNIVAFVIETVPSIGQAYATWFAYFEIFSVAVFTVEYGLRLWTAIEVPFLSRLPAWKARTRFALRAPMLIDLAAILPFYLGQLLPIDLRILRILRLLRFLKLSRYSPALHTLIRVLANESRPLAGASLLMAAMVLFASTGIYYLESQAQPDKFGSIPQAAWWAIATLTTVGYGDVTPITAWGKLFGSFVMIAGLCVLALPVAIISTGFAQEMTRRDFVVNWSLMSRIPLFSELDAREVAEIMPLLHAHNLPPGIEIIEPGSQGAAIYFISIGQVRMVEGNTTRIYGSGDFFGAVAMLSGEHHRASFRTTTRCRLLKLHRNDYSRLAAAHPDIGQHIREIAEARMTDTRVT
ncbi:MAG: cyclic nucleotide-gated ion channel/potassium channel family protein [Alphaproteobacteria bacterium]|nr:cyclic nucleotide-gated ion channel/potassium channel family protein [Alphaproteobacteria bacterium]